MKTNEKTSWAWKAAKCGLVALAIVVFLAYPKTAICVAAAAIVVWAFDRKAPQVATASAAGCANASSSAVAAGEEKPAEPTPSKREVMRCWVALF